MSISITPFIKSFLISFPPSKDLDISGYKIFGVPTYTLAGATDFTASGDSKGVGNCIEEGTDTMYTIPVPIGGEWMVKIAAYDTFGEDVLNYSAPITFTIATTNPLDLVAPDAPHTLNYSTSTIGEGSSVYEEALVSWVQDIIPDDFANFIVRYRRKIGTNDSPWIEESITDSSIRSCVITPLDINQQYDIQISAIDRWNNQSVWSPILIVSTEDQSIVAPVSGLSFTSGVSSVTAIWNPSSHSAFLNYAIDLSTTSDFSAGVTHAFPTEPKYTFAAIVGVTYYVRVKVVTSLSTESVWATSSNITTFDTLSANRITTGTLSSTTTISVGDNSLLLDGINKRVTVNDGTRDRVYIGKLGTGDYGVDIKDTSGLSVVKVSSTSGAVIQNATVGNLVVGSAGILCGSGASAFKVWEAAAGKTSMYIGSSSIGATNSLYFDSITGKLKINADIVMSPTSTINWGQVVDDLGNPITILPTNKVTNSTTPPTVDVNAGDTWFNTNTVDGTYYAQTGYIWNGTTWVRVSARGTNISTTGIYTGTLTANNYVLGDGSAYGSIKSYGWNDATTTKGIKIQDGATPVVDIRGGTISGASITGGTITGGVVQTSTSAVGSVKMYDSTHPTYPNCLVVFDINGVVRVKLGLL